MPHDQDPPRGPGRVLSAGGGARTGPAARTAPAAPGTRTAAGEPGHGAAAGLPGGKAPAAPGHPPAPGAPGEEAAPGGMAVPAAAPARGTAGRTDPAASPAGGTDRRTDAAASPAGGTDRRTDPAAWLIALVVAAAYTVLSVFRYLRLRPGSWDLGIYTEYVRQVAHLHAPVVPIRQAGFNLLGDHFQPAVALLAPAFRVFPSPATLLVAQALLTGLSVVPVCRAAQVLAGTGISRALGIAYGFSWGLQQMIIFDFHEIAFAVPLLAFCLSALARGYPRAATWWALPLVFVKEDQGFTVAAIGVIMLVAGLRPGRGLPGRAERPASAGTWAWRGGLLIAWGLAWSALAILVIIPHFSIAHHYQYWHDGGVIGANGKAFSLPGLLGQFAHAGAEKLATMLMLLLPAAFLTLGSPLALAAVPGLLLRFLSTNSYFWGTDWHYNATLMPIVFVAAADTVARVRARPARPLLAAVVPRYGAALMLVVSAWLAVRQPLAGLWQPQTYAISRHVRAEEAAMARVPPGTTVEATLSMLAPLAARDDTSWIGTTGISDPRYLVFDATDSGWSRLPAATPLRFLEVRHPGTVYRQIFRADGVYVFRRTWPTG